MSDQEDIKRYFANRQKEIDGAALYNVLAEKESQPQMAEVYRKLAASEEKHAATWEKKLEELKVTIPPRKPTWRAATMIWLAQRFGTQFVLPTITSNEKADSQAYDGQSDEEAKEFSLQEKSHARLLSVASNSTGGMSGGVVAQLEGRHKAGGGNALRAAVLGANDGLVSILSLTMGVAGATNSTTRYFDRRAWRACSQAQAPWRLASGSRCKARANSTNIRSRSKRKRSRKIPKKSRKNFRSSINPKVCQKTAPREMAAHMMADKANILDTLAREELGIDPEELGGSAYEAAFTSFFLFAFGALFPMIAYFFWSGTLAIILSLVISAVGLFIIGAAITLMTGKSVWFSGTRQVLVGIAAAALTYGVGKLIGVSLG